jgi:hypothetical protein
MDAMLFHNLPPPTIIGGIVAYSLRL